MIETNRRSFLAGTLALIVAPALPIITPPKLPRIYGNGVDDDTAGFQAALDGLPFLADHENVRAENGILWLAQGTYVFKNTIHLRGSIQSNCCHYDLSRLEDEDVFNSYDNPDFSIFNHDYFEFGSNGPKTLIRHVDRRVSSFMGNPTTHWDSVGYSR
jgi:hypothetical protein